MTKAFTIERWTPASRVGFVGIAIIVALFAIAPVLLKSGTLDRLTALFIYVMLAAMWNALAGYGGLVSIGQQMFFGLGAYFTIRLADAGINPFASTFASAIIVAGVAWLISYFMLHLKGGEFAIGMWVLSAFTHLLVNLDNLIQGETGTSLISMNAYPSDGRRIAIYFMALGSMLLLLGILYALLRSKSGAAIQAIRDNEVATTSVGVIKTKRKLFVLAAFGIGLAGALWLCSALTFQPKTYFSVQWTAYMIFMVLVGGIGKFEGAIIGAVLFFVIETWFGSAGVWYLIGLGLAAVIFSLYFPKGIWGAIEQRFGITLLPIGYKLNIITNSGESKL